MEKRAILRAAFCFLIALSAVTGIMTWRDLRPMPPELAPIQPGPLHFEWTDRHGAPLALTYANLWNLQHRVPLHEMPPLLVKTMVMSEDRRFFEHGGVDWAARAKALVQNLRAGQNVRGASTITEQVVRMFHPRPRTLWSRWVEGFEAMRFERRFSKQDILEFYLNQVPYASQRRGVVQGARLYFGRDLNTLNDREILILAVLVRAPSRLHLPGREANLNRAVSALAGALAQEGETVRFSSAGAGRPFPATLEGSELPVDASHFLRHVSGLLQKAPPAGAPTTGLHPSSLRISPGHGHASLRDARIQTTLDGSLQRRIQDILDTRLKDLQARSVENGAVLVVDHTRDTILSWVNGGAGSAESAHAWIDAVTVPRQPGSTLKPFLYGLALQKGWTAATLIDDAPMAEPLRWGLHPYQNYSRTHYGLLRVRDALGNSLNIPAVKTLEFVGLQPFFSLLKELGFLSLTEHWAHYGSGLALGNGEVTLFELVRAYAVLARGGLWRPLRATVHTTPEAWDPPRRIFSQETASLLGHMLSDPQARRLEFGAANVFRFPVQTAVKTGTSNDHRDAWAVGFNHRYTVGVWMGNLDARPSSGVTGTLGPGLVLRAVFAELNQNSRGAPLSLSPRLIRLPICRKTGLRASSHCPVLEEYFLPASAPERVCSQHAIEMDLQPDFPLIHAGRTDSESPVFSRLLQPSPGLQLAMDPHLPDEKEVFAFRIPPDPSISKVEWLVNGDPAGLTFQNTFAWHWQMSRGDHTAQAVIWREGREAPERTAMVHFTVH